LADDWTITTVPSEALLLRAVATLEAEASHLLAVGSGSGGSQFGMTTQDIVEDHTREVAANFPAAEVLVGPQATPKRVIEAISRSTHVHIAAHGSHDLEAWFQCLYLEATDDDGRHDGRLFAHDIVQLDLRHVSLVTLSACWSAMGLLRR
jgi:CHAT domain-containing protein